MAQLVGVDRRGMLTRSLRDRSTQGRELANSQRLVPELPEVETVRAGAEPHLLGRRLLAVHLTRDDLRWPMPKAALQQLTGRCCTAVTRRSKYLLVHFDGTDAPAALIHLGMTGRVLVEATTATAERPPYRTHEHWRMDFGDRLMRFIDPRRFGALDVVPRSQFTSHPRLVDLGQEPLEAAFDGAFLHRFSRARTAAIKSLLMDSHVLVGVGNIYASEACWRAHVRPRRAAKTLTRHECTALAIGVQEVLRAAITAGGTSFRDYVGVDEHAGFFARELAVYERVGEPCRRCSHLIKRAVDAGRSTYWCAGCQK